MRFSALCLFVLGMTATADPTYFDRVKRVLESVRTDVSAMTGPAEAAASRVSAGGHLWVAGHKTLVSELSGRAGGLMCVQSLGDDAPAAGDVVIFGNVGKAPLPDSLRNSGALIVVLGDEPVGPTVFCLPVYANENGVSETLASTIPAWVFTGELVAALTRLGTMPVIFETIGMPGGVPRIQKYQAQGLLFHTDRTVPPVAAGVVGLAYCDKAVGALDRVQRECGGKLLRVAQWAAESKRAGKKVHMYSMGHMFPAEVEETAIGGLFTSTAYYSGFSYIDQPAYDFDDGDTVVHIGYQHPPYELLEKVGSSGARIAYVDILEHRDYRDNQNVIWIDPMWMWADGCVRIDGYDVPMLPLSGVINGAIAWEIYRSTSESLGESGGGK
ncbi:MAG: hypothetical protein AMXMBFR84_18370 [Candidatus Hydrogenedentota bacterium]